MSNVSNIGNVGGVDVQATLAKIEQLKREFEQYKVKNGNGNITAAKTAKTAKKSQKPLTVQKEVVIRKRIPMDLVINGDGTCSIFNVPYDAKGRLSGSGTSIVHYSTGRPQVVDEKHHIQLSIIEYANKW